MQYLSLLLTTLFLFTACERPPTETASAGEQRYDLKGKVISVDRANKKAKIDHEEIPGYMPAMTMDFPIRENWVWDDLAPGSEIRAQLVVDNAAKEPYWLEKI